MTKRRMKYNPSFLTEEELIESFVVRHADLDIIVGVIGENVTDSNQHVLVIGPRGIGKTTMVHRVAAEIEKNAELRGRWYPLIFSEESYEVVSAGEFWLEALFHLSEQADDDKWRRTYAELKNETDDQRLAERALAQLLDFADSQGKRILMIVENLNMLLGDLTSDDEAWKIRHTLLNEPRLMLLATATNRFEHIENSSQAMFEMFKMQELKPLDDDECNQIWAQITGERLLGERIKPIRILTGGNPRLLTIIAKFSAHRSFRKLLDDLVDLIDDHTEYFKSHLDNLPATERKVYLALAGLWDASTAREIAQAARLDVNKTSSLLSRLINRGAVVVEEHGKKTKWYVVAERMYNIYYLMRRRGKPADRVKATVKFLVSMYDPESAARLITDEACGLSPEHRRDHCLAYEAAIQEIPDRQLLEKVIAATPKEFFDTPYLSDEVRRFVSENNSQIVKGKFDKQLNELLKEVRALNSRGIVFGKKGNFEEAIKHFDTVINKVGKSKDTIFLSVVADAMHNKCYALNLFKRPYDALTVYDEMIMNFADASDVQLKVIAVEAMFNKAATLEELNLTNEEIAVYNELISRFSGSEEVEICEQVAKAMVNKGITLGQLNLFDEEFAVFDEVITRFGNADDESIREQVAKAMYNKGCRLGLLNRYDEEIAVFDEVTTRFANTDEAVPSEYVVKAMVNKGSRLGQLERSEEAIAVYDKVISLFVEADDVSIREQVAKAMFNKGYRLGELERFDAEIAAYDEVITRFAEADNFVIREQVAKAMFNKGYRLGELNHFEEEIATHDELIARFAEAEEELLRESVARALSNKSRRFELLGKYEEAVAALLSAIDFASETKWPTVKLIKLYLKMPGRTEDAGKAAKMVIDKHPGDSELLNSVAWTFYKQNNSVILSDAEKWATEAVALAPDDTHAHHTLACVLSALSKSREALEAAKRYIQDTAVVEKTIEDAIELFVELAASGYAKEALGILVNSDAEKHLEPLVVGLKLYSGENVKTAPEIREIAKDVIKRIEERKKLRGV